MPELSDSKKIQIIHDDPKFRTEWNRLTKEERRFMLDGMNLGVDERWILGLLDDARAMRQQEAA